MKSFIKAFLFILLLIEGGYCDVLYTFDYQKNDFIVGEKKESLVVGYTPLMRYSHKRSKLVGSFMKRWFGKSKELRYTTVISLSEDLIREVDYGRNRIIETSFSKIKDPMLEEKIKNKVHPVQKEILDDRYIVKKPVISITELQDIKELRGFPVKHLKADLKLETYDKKKDALSITLIKLDLYLTKEIKGYKEYLSFNKNFARRLGVNSAKFGNLEALLKHWTFPLNEIDFKKAEGIAVKYLFRVKARYITNPGKSDEKVVERVLTDVEIVLREVKEGPFNKDIFKAPQKWKVIKDSDTG